MTFIGTFIIIFVLVFILTDLTDFVNLTDFENLRFLALDKEEWKLEDSSCFSYLRYDIYKVLST